MDLRKLCDAIRRKQGQIAALEERAAREQQQGPAPRSPRRQRGIHGTMERQKRELRQLEREYASLCPSNDHLAGGGCVVIPHLGVGVGVGVGVVDVDVDDRGGRIGRMYTTVVLRAGIRSDAALAAAASAGALPSAIPQFAVKKIAAYCRSVEQDAECI
eukprot:gene20613-33704_t